MFLKFPVLLDGNPSNNRHSEFNVASEVSYFCRILAYRPGQVFGGALLIRASQRRGVSGSRDQNIASQCCSGTNMRQSLVIWGYRNHAETSNSVTQRKRNLFCKFSNDWGILVSNVDMETFLLTYDFDCSLWQKSILWHSLPV